MELATGLRRGELLGLRWRDVDLNTRTVTVNQGLVRTKEKDLTFQPPKTKQGKRTISIPVDVAGVLKFHEKRQGNLRDEAKEAWTKEMVFLSGQAEINDLVFTNEIGMPLCPRDLTRHFERQLVKAGLPRISFHGLRHTFATLSLQQGVDMRTTSENLGHFDPGFTLSVYSGVTARMKQEATDKIGGLLAECLRQ